MNKTLPVLLCTSVVVSAGLLMHGASDHCLLSVPKARAEEKKRASPHETVTATLNGKKITVTYGRPYKKGRNIFGELVPFGQVWRTGADEATTLTTEGDITIGSLSVPKGTYGLFTVPGDKEWTLVLNKDAKQWGAYNYDQKKDLGRTPMKVGAAATPPGSAQRSGAPSIEQLTISLDTQGKTGTLTVTWDKTAASVALSAK